MKFDHDYNNIVMNEKKLCISDMEFHIYRMSGVKKFSYAAQKSLITVIPEESVNKYVIVDWILPK